MSYGDSVENPNNNLVALVPVPDGMTLQQQLDTTRVLAFYYNYGSESSLPGYNPLPGGWNCESTTGATLIAEGNTESQLYGITDNIHGFHFAPLFQAVNAPDIRGIISRNKRQYEIDNGIERMRYSKDGSGNPISSGGPDNIPGYGRDWGIPDDPSRSGWPWTKRQSGPAKK